MESFALTILENVKNGNTEKAIQNLEIISEKDEYSFLSNDSLLLKNRYSQLKTNYFRGLITNEDFNVESNRINFTLIGFISKLTDEKVNTNFTIEKSFLKSIILRFEKYFSYLESIVFHNKKFINDYKWWKDNFTWEFFIYNHFLSFIVVLISSISFFVLFYRSNFINALRDRGSEAMFITLIFLLFFLLSQLIIIVIASIPMKLIYKYLGSKVSFTKYLKALLILSFFEFIPAFVTSIGIFTFDERKDGSFAFSIAFLVILIGVRLFYFKVGYRALDTLHIDISKEKRNWGYCLGFIPFYGILSCFSALFVFMIMIVFISGFD